MGAGFGLMFMFGGFAPITPRTTCTGGLVAIDIVRNVLRYKDDDTQDDTAICRMIQAASTRFLNDVDQPIIQDSAYLHRFTGKGKRCHTPDIHKINGISKLEYWKESSLSWAEIAAGTYYGDDTDSVWQIWYPDGFSRGCRYRATLDVGYATIPADIQGIVLNAVVLAYKDYSLGKGEGRLGVQSRADGAGTGDQSVTITYNQDLFDKRWKGVVNNYKEF